MSFSGNVKEELLKKTGSGRHCILAELAAILCSCGHVQKNRNNQKILRISSENEGIIRKCFTLTEKAFNINTSVCVSDELHSRRGRVCLMEIADPEMLRAVLQGTKVEEGTDAGELRLRKDALIVQRECCRRAFVRGAFLSSGSISDPNKGYHFEIVCSDEEKAEFLQMIIRSFQIDAKTVVRKRSHVVYVKEGAQIVDLLALMGAGVALMDLENVRILKEMRNSVNRKVNCETANINKTVSAAVKQMEDIRLIEARMGLDSLSEELEETAVIRLQYPEATLKELGLMLSPQVGKSGVNHRLRRLGIIADKLRETEEDSL